MDNRENFKARLDAYLAENFLEEGFSTTDENFFAEDIKYSESPKKILRPPKTAASAARICYSRKINFKKVFEENEGETFSEMMTRLVAESGEKNSVIYNRAQIDRQLFSRIKKNKNYQPSKDTAVALAIALKLDAAKAKDFLAAAGYTLSKTKRDLIISFFIENKIFDVAELNDYLYEYKQTLLFGR